MIIKKSRYNHRQLSKGARELMRDLFRAYSFTKKQRRLLMALTSLRPESTTRLSAMTKSSNIKSLVRDTNIRITRHHLESQIEIRASFWDIGIKGHYGLRLKPFSLQNPKN